MLADNLNNTKLASEGWPVSRNSFFTFWRTLVILIFKKQKSSFGEFRIVSKSSLTPLLSHFQTCFTFRRTYYSLLTLRSHVDASKENCHAVYNSRPSCVLNFKYFTLDKIAIVTWLKFSEHSFSKEKLFKAFKYTTAHTKDQAICSIKKRLQFTVVIQQLKKRFVLVPQVPARPAGLGGPDGLHTSSVISRAGFWLI